MRLALIVLIMAGCGVLIGFAEFRTYPQVVPTLCALVAFALAIVALGDELARRRRVRRAPARSVLRSARDWEWPRR